MKKIFIILILIIAVFINIAGAKLVFTDKKTFTYLNCNINCDILPNFLKANFV